MVNYKPKHGDMEMWMICVAVGGDHELIDKMQINEDGSYPVIFSVGGVELDFSRVAGRVDEAISELVTEKAKDLLDARYGDLLDELTEIQEKISNQKERFQYDWEK